jgi:hypothetical protein
METYTKTTLLKDKGRFQNDAFKNSSVVTCISCRGNVFTEPLHSNERGICLWPNRLMGELYEVRRWNGLGCHDVHARFYKYRYRNSLQATNKQTNFMVSVRELNTDRATAACRRSD